jgi:hypothetical protein
MDAQRLNFMRKSGLMAPPDYVVIDNQSQYRDPFASSDRMAFNNKMFNTAPKFGQVMPLKEATPLVDPKPILKKRKTSIDGDTIAELTNNIIKDEPTVALVTKAFKKMAEMLTEERDAEFLKELE